MTNDTFTALLLNPFLTFDEAEREHRALSRSESTGATTLRTSAGVVIRTEEGSVASRARDKRRSRINYRTCTSPRY